jgi:aspartate/methionine/tyrosine aminotransferase
MCNPGDRVLVPEPSYPLLGHLARLDGVEPVPYQLVFHGRWEIDPGSLSAAEKDDVRAVIAVSPNNPTGSYLSPSDHQALLQVCRRHHCALIVDEVFSGYPISMTVPVTSVLDHSSDVLTFCLGGLSKAVGLPQLKLGWFVVDGVDSDVESALGAVGFVMDTYLSVSTPVQLATPDLLVTGQALIGQIRQRITENFRRLERLAKRFSSVSVFPVEGGWYAVMRMPALCSEEELVLRLLKEACVYVHPGYFFDFQNGVFLVVSLLPPTERFSYAMEKVFAVATNME